MNRNKKEVVKCPLPKALEGRKGKEGKYAVPPEPQAPECGTGRHEPVDSIGNNYLLTFHVRSPFSERTFTT
jgi:hypothetical protein